MTKQFSSSSISHPDQLDFTDSNTLPTAEEVTQKLAEKVLSDDAATLPPSETVEIANSLSAAENKIWHGFEDILKNKNDNDPRLDTELKSLSPALKQALYQRYNTLPAEDRNARGLVVFLIARDLQTPADTAFLKQVYQEEPCLSLENCSASSTETTHLSGTNQTTMNYPQLAGLYQLERQLKDRPEILQDAQLRAEILEVLKNAENFPVPAVQNKARQIRRAYGL